MNKLLKDAIADAKAVRETALANAKAALEEAFAPKLQSMLSHKIKEEMEGEEVEDESSEEEKMENARMQNLAGITSEGEDEEAMEDETSDDDMDFEDDEDSSDDDMDSEDYEDSSDDEEEVSDEDLEEILRELEADVEQPGDESHGKKNPAGLPDDESEEDYAGLEDDEMDESEDPEQMEMDEEIDLEEIIRALREEDESEEEDEEEESSKEELEEAYNVIKYLRSKLNEVNLLNAKLLFVNKLFRKGELTESQKVKIIETFDRAKNVREAKLIYSTLAESVNNKAAKKAPKTRMNEGFASAPQKKTQIITESNGVYDRFKTLMNYNR